MLAHTKQDGTFDAILYFPQYFSSLVTTHTKTRRLLNIDIMYYTHINVT